MYSFPPLLYQDDSTGSAGGTRESTPVGCQSPLESENTTPTGLATTEIIVEKPEESHEDDAQTSENAPVKGDTLSGKSMLSAGRGSKAEVRRSNSVPNAPITDIDHVTRSLRLRRKISLTDNKSVPKVFEKSEKKLQRSAAKRMNSALKSATRKLGYQFLEKPSRVESDSPDVSAPLLEDSPTSPPDITDNPQIEFFLPSTEDSTSQNDVQVTESKISSPSQEAASGIPAGAAGNPSGNPDTVPQHLRLVPPIIISAASVAATCVRLVRVRTRLDGGRDHFDTRWGYKARRRAAARRAALEKERQEREEREKEKDGEDSVISEDGK